MGAVIEVKEKPILFNTEMIQAILEGRKTVTRRVIKPQPTMVDENGAWQGRNPYSLMSCPYGKPGDELWVRETFASLCKNADPYCWCDEDEKKEHHFYQYKADTYREFRGEGKYDRYPGNWDDALTESGQTHHPKEADHIPRWKPSIHMPRRASRIQLTVTDIRVERVQDISEEDAIAEGIEVFSGATCNPYRNYLKGREGEIDMHCSSPVRSFQTLWDSINAGRNGGIYSWESNPYVWVVNFTIAEEM